MNIKKSGLLSPLFWSLGITYRASPKLFILSSIITIYTNGISGIINAYIISMTTASVANLAIGKVTLSVPIFWAAIFGGFLLINNLLNQYYRLVIERYGNMLEILLYSKYAQKVMVLPQEQIDDPKTQEKLTSATREIWRITNTTSSLQQIIASVIGYIGAIFLLWRYAWGIALILLIIVPLLIYFNYRQIKRTRQSWQESTQDYRIASGLFYNFSNPFKIFQVRIMGAKQKILDIYKLHFTSAFNIEYKATKKNAITVLFIDTLSLAVDVGTRIWAIILVGAGRLAFDQFVFVMGLIQQASNQTWSLGTSVQELQSSYIATTAFKDIIDFEPDTKGTEKIGDSLKGIDININNVDLVYRDGTRAIKNVSMHIKSGQKIAIVGENGAGKSSLLKLILMQYKPTGGSIDYNGINSTKLDQDNLYKNTSVLAQDYFLFDDLTIKQNIIIGAKDGITDEEISKNIELVSMQSKIKSLKNGLNTRLDVSYKDGADLSGGQRQRLAIARALSKDARLLVLDEPTSSIDAKAERHIFNNIFATHIDATVIIVSHRFATVRKADYIYVVDNGVLAEQGTHEQLMQNNKLYAELYTLQAEDFK